jgi:hypothetical protein
MGHNPPPPRPKSAGQAYQMSATRLTRDLRGRGSRFGWRQRRSYQACLTLIKMREAILGMTADPWLMRPPPSGHGIGAMVERPMMQFREY